MKQKLIEENDDLKAKLEVTKRQMSEKIQSAEVKLKAYEKKSEVLLKDLSVASRLTTQGARILISRDNSDVPQVTGIDLAGIDLTPIKNGEGKDQAIDGFVNGLPELSHFHTLIPPRPFDERLVAHLRVLRHLHLDISSLELDADALKLLAQIPNLTGVGIRVHQLKSLKSFPHLSEFSIAMSDPFGNMILTPELGPFEDGGFPNTERLIFADLIQELAPLMKLPNLRDLEIGKAWSGVGYRVTDDDLTALRRLTKLRTLVIHANYNSERERIAEALPKCRVKFSE